MENPKVQRTRLRLAYNGGPFCGWQVQPSDRTVQGDLENALTKLMHQPIATMGAGRTDTGVHAKEMYVHFDWDPTLIRDSRLADMDQLVHRLNRFLDPAIHIYEAELVHADWHARFDATSRSYEYLMCATGSPFMVDRAWMVSEMPDVQAMNRAASILLKETDFASFCKAGSDNKTTLCDVRVAHWEPREDYYVFHITADRFLRNMVRAVVGSLYEVGRGRWSVEEFAQRIDQKNRGAMGTSAPAHGLYLSKVTY
ncbi:MAG: tRNA pseudouridine(38-40) synthase TruA [Bacteroidota bacterium]|jgi:tRNA pseudouridine38-40 synthase